MIFRGFLWLVGLAVVSAQGWQSYVDEQLIGAGMEKAAIFGLDGSVWAKSNNIAPTIGETTTIVAQFSDPAIVFANGITLGGMKFMGIKGDSYSLYGKKGAGGIICVKTNQAVIAGIYNENLQPGNAAILVEKLGDYLRDNGY